GPDLCASIAADSGGVAARGRALRLEPLVIGASPLVAAPERGLAIRARIALAKELDGVALCRTAGAHQQRGFEALAVYRLVALEIASRAAVLDRLGVSQADPPLLSRRVHALGASGLQHLGGALWLVGVVGRDDHDRLTAPEGVLVEK